MLFRAPFGLRHRHTQSLLGGWPMRGRVVRRRSLDFVKRSAANILELPDNVRLLGLHTLQPQTTRGLVVVLHGWEGCADSSYMLSLGCSLYASGFDVFRLNFRDHGETQALNAGLFHSCRIDEVVAAVAAVQNRWPDRPLYLAGFSLGGNFALRVAARAVAAGIDLERVVAVCPVISPKHTMQALEQGLWIYRSYFLRRWRRSLRSKATAFPELYDFGDLRRFPTLTSTTDFFVRRYTEFADLDAYLNGYAITGDALAELRVNSVLIATEDDPINPIADLDDVARSPALSVQRLSHGGHCGLLDSYSMRSWADSAVAELLQQ